jgi:flagellar biosynthesis protein FliQ
MPRIFVVVFKFNLFVAEFALEYLPKIISFSYYSLIIAIWALPSAEFQK